MAKALLTPTAAEMVLYRFNLFFHLLNEILLLISETQLGPAQVG